MIDLQATFEKFKAEQGKFGRVQGNTIKRPDLCAFFLLDNLLPGGSGKIIDWAGNDEIALDIDCDKLAEVATEADILTLIRCSVRFDDDTNRLAMFV